MRLIIHMGLHKTGSTYLQYLFDHNRAALAERGVWFEHVEDYPAHHHIAWQLQHGRTEALGRMIDDAVAAGCGTVLLSSEELEALLREADGRLAIERLARARGIKDIEWHLVTREPGATFVSHYHFMHILGYVDVFKLFYDVMRGGALTKFPALGDVAQKFGFNCFDHAHYIGNFADSTRFPVIVHRFEDRDPFPGWRFAQRIGILDALTELPGDDCRNARQSLDQVASGYVQRMCEAIVDPDDCMELLPHLEGTLRANLEGAETCARLIGKRYQSSWIECLERFCPDMPYDVAANVA